MYFIGFFQTVLLPTTLNKSSNSSLFTYNLWRQGAVRSCILFQQIARKLTKQGLIRVAS